MVTANDQINKDITIAFDDFQKARKTCASFMDVLKHKKPSQQKP